jgi:hypothetical protein
MTRITQAQVKIAETIEREGPLSAAQIANAYGARVSNARRTADTMVENKHLMFWNGRYNLTQSGCDDVLLSHAAITLRQSRRNEAQKPVEETTKADLFTSVQTEADGFQWSPVSMYTTTTLEPKADPIPDEVVPDDAFDDAYPLVTAAVALDVGGQLIVLDVDEAQALRRSLNKFFEGK